MDTGDEARRGGAIEATALTRKSRGAEEAGKAGALIGSALVIAKPGIVAGVALTSLAGMFLASRGMPDPEDALLCLSTVAAAAAGAAMVNVVLDAPQDARMPRLAARVDALGKVGSGAALFLALLLIAGSLALSIGVFNGTTTALLLAAVLSYSVLYTLFLKRRSPYGTIPGGIPGALPVLIGYSAIAGRVGVDALILFLTMLLWQPPHFWALALAHQEEYRDAGVPVLPVAMGEPYTRVLIFLYAVGLLPMTLALWVFGYCSAHFAWFSAALWCYFLWSCYRNTVLQRRFGRAFAASILYIMGVLLGVIVDVGLR